MWKVTVKTTYLPTDIHCLDSVNFQQASRITNSWNIFVGNKPVMYTSAFLLDAILSKFRLDAIRNKDGYKYDFSVGSFKFTVMRSTFI